MGICIVSELLGVEPEKIAKVKEVREILDRAVSESGLHIIASPLFYQFSPQGVSAVYLLRESHLSIHTWPEYRYAALDIFTCGDSLSALKAFEFIIKAFKPEEVRKQMIKREIYEYKKVRNPNCAQSG
ncbi:adenosylmethionine decarboxylase [Candidatus Aerophobetes bacterium]|uniref:Adenosylmethionine decarboxylase n=1 Tax=Aerophobetes bacterium TaxID=2030807 RepID=A0A7V5HYM6_UNCAE|nr:adenosylmethionine decarboxylase [Candidatus Aerophobetes bacterium]HHF98350.1 adenosylmethionine decarboxylase [Candidatus Aerophobetes bacterium]